MKEELEDFYGIFILGFIKINKDVYKIKLDSCFYYLKKTNHYDFQKTIDYIESLHLCCFVNVIKGKDGSVLFSYENQYYYLMESLSNSEALMKEIKIKQYFKILAYLHNHSFYNIKVNKEYFKKIYKDTFQIIQERMAYYNQIMNDYEVIEYKSPSQWLFVLNYYRLDKSLQESLVSLRRFMNKVEDFHVIRVCLTYKHFDYDHIFLKNKKLISIDNLQIDIPIYDIYDVYHKLPDILFDLDCFSEYYLNSVFLNEEEKILLCTLLKIVPIIYLDDNEINNIIKLSRLLYYVDSIQSLCLHLEQEIKGEIH